MSEDCHESNPYDSVQFIRDLLAGAGHVDAITATSSKHTYAGDSLQVNSLDRCLHCDSPYGHYNHCPTINRASAEAHSAARSQADIIIAHGLGVDLTR